MCERRQPDEPSDGRPKGSSERADESSRSAKRKMVVFAEGATDQEIADMLNAMRVESENDDA